MTASTPDCPWLVTTTAPWITITSPVSGTGNATVTFSFAANTDASQSGQILMGGQTFTVTQGGSNSTPAFGSFDTPVDGTSGLGGSFAISSWALDDIEVKRVVISRDPLAGESGNIPIGDAVFVDGARPDVAALYSTLPFHTRSGWGYLLLSNMLPNQGNGTFTLHADAIDAEGKTFRLGDKTVTIDNLHDVKPFGAIDTPGQGAIASGPSYINFGWALTPQPKNIPTDGSTITVFIDGAPVGGVTYNNFRTDVASLFPGLVNSGGAIGFHIFDTTTLANGLHTIAWGVVDSNGDAEGIGSRYFAVNNVLASQRIAPSLRAMQAAQTAPPSASLSPVQFRLGFNPRSPLLTLAPNDASPRIVVVPSLGRVELRFTQASCGPVTGQQIVAGNPAALPIGSTMDPSGTFVWQPGPAFLGTYHFEFTVPSCGGPQTIPVDIAVTSGR